MSARSRSQDFSRDRDAARLQELARALSRPLTNEVTERLTRYVELVVTWNKKLDLTAARDAAGQLEVLLADALFLSDPTITPRGTRIVDVGSGAGAPALPLLLARLDLHVTLVEPLQKRVAFLRTVIGTLGCVAQATVVHSKVDPTHATVPNGPFDIALSRATFSPEIWAPLGTQLAATTFVLLAAQAEPAAPEDCVRSATYEYELPFSHAPRRLVVYKRS